MNRQFYIVKLAVNFTSSYTPHHFLDTISKEMLLGNATKNDIAFYKLRIKSGGG